MASAALYASATLVASTRQREALSLVASGRVPTLGAVAFMAAGTP
jgi:hypothetical protein